MGRILSQRCKSLEGSGFQDRLLQRGFELSHGPQRELPSPILCGPDLKFRVCTLEIRDVFTKNC
jgi:hypothetical protein